MNFDEYNIPINPPKEKGTCDFCDSNDKEIYFYVILKNDIINNLHYDCKVMCHDCSIVEDIMK